MTVSGSSSPVHLLESVLDARKAREDVSVAVLDKAQDVVKQQGKALINVLEQAGAPSGASGGLDVYA